MGEEPIGAQRDRLDLDRARQHGDDDVAALDHLGGRAGGLGAQLGENRHRLRIHVMDEKVESLLAQIGGHGPPHAPQADEADSIHG